MVTIGLTTEYFASAKALQHSSKYVWWDGMKVPPLNTHSFARLINALRSKQNGCHFQASYHMYLGSDNHYTLIPINKISPLVQLMSWCHIGDSELFVAMTNNCTDAYIFVHRHLCKISVNGNTATVLKLYNYCHRNIKYDIIFNSNEICKAAMSI